MKVLVTGASGFIGRPLTVALTQAGYGVRAAVRDRRGQQFPARVEVAMQPDLKKDMEQHIIRFADKKPDWGAFADSKKKKPGKEKKEAEAAAT